MDEMEKMAMILVLLAITTKMEDVAKMINNGEKVNALSTLKDINDALDALEEVLED